MRLLVDREHQGVLGRIDVQPDDRREFGRELGVVGMLEGSMRRGCRRCACQIRCTDRKEIPVVLAMARPVQWVASPGGSAQVKATTRRTVASAKGALPGLRLASRKSPSTPASAKRRCQRQTAGRPTPARLATAATLSRPTECRMIRARATCF